MGLRLPPRAVQRQAITVRGERHVQQHWPHQELGRFEEAVHFYKRSLETLNLSDLNAPTQIEHTKRIYTDCKNQSAVVNLYSTVWYNLRLILDKLRSYDESMVSFEMALALRQAKVGPNHPDTSSNTTNLDDHSVLQSKRTFRSHSLTCMELSSIGRLRSSAETKSNTDQLKATYPIVSIYSRHPRREEYSCVK